MSTLFTLNSRQAKGNGEFGRSPELTENSVCDAYKIIIITLLHNVIAYTFATYAKFPEIAVQN